MNHFTTSSVINQVKKYSSVKEMKLTRTLLLIGVAAICAFVKVKAQSGYSAAVSSIANSAIASIETISKALDLIKDQQNHIRAQQFHGAIKELVDEFKNSYSDRARTLIFESKGYLEDAMIAYFLAQQSVSDWCGVAAERLQSYLQLLQNFSLAKARLQHRIVIPVLEEAIEKFSSTDEKLDLASKKFARGSEEVASLIGQLNTDFDEKNGNLNKEMRRLSKAQTCARWVCLNRKPSSRIDKVKKELQDHIGIIKQFDFNYNLRNAFAKAAEKIVETRTKFKDEIRTIGDAETQAQTRLDSIKDVDDIDELGDAIQNEIKISVEQLIEECKKYRQQYKEEKEVYDAALNSL